MTIKADTVVYIAFTLKDKNGELLDEATKDMPLPFVAGHDQIIPSLEAALIGKKDGDKINLVIEPEDAFGEYDEAYVQEASKDMFDQIDDLIEGMDVEVEVETEDGNTLAMARIKSIKDNKVTLDLNHPLAGKTLDYSIEVISTREMTAEEQDIGNIRELID
ncbi:MAG: FKBP-type peptidyl-prolyl cis-trans isomerase [Candidatus Marinamargulisbacteria bacterium]